MILQYKGYNNNWCYEEANTIVWSNVWVGKETRDYRKDGVRWKLHQEKRKPLPSHVDMSETAKEASINNIDLEYARELHEAVDRLIKKETKCAEDITYLIGNKKFDEMENVCVVTLKDKCKHITYVFENGVYILNNSGGTVQKIA